MKLTQKHIALGIIIASIIVSIVYLELQKPSQSNVEGSHIVVMPRKEKEKIYPPAVEIVNPKGFINTSFNGSGEATPITISEFVGKKVILVDFWTYSCINCQRTTPYLNAWWEKYKDKGLVIIGVHTPEFDFEKEYENVLAATKKFDIDYPVVLDNDYSTWRAYGNRYWPRKYLIDIDGYIVYDHIGEGAYEETEKKIQELLNERLAVLGETGEIPAGSIEAAATPAVGEGRSPEVYFGALRNEFFGNGTRGRTGDGVFTVTTNPPINTLYLSGEWKIDQEYAQNKTMGARILFKYKGRSVNLVAESDSGSKIRIFKDGKKIGPSSGAGSDVGPDGNLTIKESGLYNIINDDYGEHLLEIIIDSPGLRAYTLTFG